MAGKYIRYRRNKFDRNGVSLPMSRSASQCNNTVGGDGGGGVFLYAPDGHSSTTNLGGFSSFHGEEHNETGGGPEERQKNIQIKRRNSQY